MVFFSLKNKRKNQNLQMRESLAAARLLRFLRETPGLSGTLSQADGRLYNENINFLQLYD